MRSSTSIRSDKVSDFIDRLTKLDAGGRACLKRNAGHTLGQARNVYQVFYAILPPSVVDHAEQEDFFLVATLFTIGTRRDKPYPSNPPANLGASLGLVRRQVMMESHDRERSTSLDRRFVALLDADREQLPFRLRQVISLLVAREIAIDWHKLLHHVRRWNADGRLVQRAWASYYFGRHPVTSETDNTRNMTNQEEVQP